MKTGLAILSVLVLLALGFVMGYTGGGGGGGGSRIASKRCEAGSPCVLAPTVVAKTSWLGVNTCKITPDYETVLVAAGVQISWILTQPPAGTIAFDSNGVVIGTKPPGGTLTPGASPDFINPSANSARDTFTWTAAPEAVRDKNERAYGFQAVWNKPGVDQAIPCTKVDPVIVNSL